MRRMWRNSWRVALATILLALPASAQLEVGDFKLHLGGDVSVGYGGSYGEADSNHNLLVGGNGQFNGSYYNPKFINFQFRPYYNRNQENANFQLVNNNAGFTAQVSLFSGSHFPGSFSYTDDSNNTGTLGLPGTSGLVTNGSGRSWNLSWSALLPKLPTLSVSFTKASGDSQVYGTNEQSSSSNHTLDLTSTYSIAGFQMNGSYLATATGLETPGFLSRRGSPTTSENRSSVLAYNVTHRLPMHGFVMGSASRFQSTADFLGESYDNTTHSYSGSASIFPGNRVNLSAGMSYSDNLAGLLNQPFVQQGGAPVIHFGQGKSDTMNFYGSVGMGLAKGLSVNANANHIIQQWAGVEYSATQFSGTATYNFSRRFLGSLTFSGGVVDMATQTGNSGAGLVSNVNFSRKLGAWDLGGQFGYSQSVSTLVAVYTTSLYSYNASVRRRLGSHAWSTYFSGAHSGLQKTEGSSHSENIGVNFSGRRYGMNASWGEGSGFSVLTSNGLVATPTSLPVSLLTPGTVVQYNGSHYGFGGSISALKRLVLVGNYTNSNNSTIAGLTTTLGRTSMMNATLRYPLRKLFLNAGYTRLSQTVTTIGGTPIVVTSYYLGVSRWFDFF